MKKFFLLALIVSLCAWSFAADEDTKVADRVEAAAQVLNDIQGAPDKRNTARGVGFGRVRGSSAFHAEGRIYCGARSMGAGWPVAALRKDGALRYSSFVTGGSFGFQIGRPGGGLGDADHE